MAEILESFILREADFEDSRWLLELAAELAEVTVSPLRGVWGERARRFAYDSIERLLPGQRTGGIHFLIACDRISGQRVGYLILNMFHECPFETRETYIEDMGVTSDFMGKGVDRFLTDQAARLTAEAGVPYMGAHISFANRRAYLAALRGNGFQLESYRVLRPCTAEALEATSTSVAALDRQKEIEQRRREFQRRRMKRRQRQQERSRRKEL